MPADRWLEILRLVLDGLAFVVRLLILPLAAVVVVRFVAWLKRELWG